MTTALARRNAWMRQLRRIQNSREFEREPEGRFKNADTVPSKKESGRALRGFVAPAMKRASRRA
jgi:hypothetical protein